MKCVLLFRGLRVTSGTLKIKKDEGNLIGISIGGGAPNCPCLYVVQVRPYLGGDLYFSWLLALINSNQFIIKLFILAGVRQYASS